MKKSFIILLNLLASANLAQAATSNTSVETLNNQGQKASKKVGLSLSSTMVTNSNTGYANQMSNSQAIGVRYKLPNKFKASLNLSGSQDLRNDREYFLGDTTLKVSRSLGRLSRDMTASGSATGYIPTSEASYKTKGLVTGLKLSGSLVYDASREVLKNLTVVYVPGVRANLFKYRVASNGASNTLYQMTNTLVFSYTVTPSVGLSFANTYIRNWTHDLNTNDFFSFDQSVSYQATKNVGVSLGHSIAGSALAANGQDSGLEIYDRDLSSYYLSVGYTY